MELKQIITRLVKESQITNLLKRGRLISKTPQVQKSGETLYLLTYVKYSMASYESIVNRLIAEKYTIQDELAIQRKYKKGVNSAEFDEYDAYAEECKVRAKAFVEERKQILGK